MVYGGGRSVPPGEQGSGSWWQPWRFDRRVREVDEAAQAGGREAPARGAGVGREGGRSRDVLRPVARAEAAPYSSFKARTSTGRCTPCSRSSPSVRLQTRPRDGRRRPSRRGRTYIRGPTARHDAWSSHPGSTRCIARFCGRPARRGRPSDALHEALRVLSAGATVCV